jgi:glycerate-2-kinase
MIIKNFEALAISPLRKQALLIAESGFAAIQTKRAVHSQVTYHAARDRLTVMGHEYALGGVEKVVVVGFGKAAFEAASALYEILDSRITCGYVLDLSGGSRGSLTCTIGTHPFPTVVNVEATKQMVEVLRGLSEKDLVLCVVSGGGSSLLCYPYNMTCEIETRIVQTLMKHGATIEELNTVRKHISQVKGGKLAEVAYPAQIINFIFSDVPGDDPALVASGPTRSFAPLRRDGARDQPAIAVEVGSKATARRAQARDGGSDLPRFSARRRMPRQAFPLK